jgi:hypothetical protein
VGASQRTEKDLSGYLNGTGDPFTMHPFELHLIFLDTAIASWRAYFVDLAGQIAALVTPHRLLSPNFN